MKDPLPPIIAPPSASSTRPGSRMWPRLIIGSVALLSIGLVIGFMVVPGPRGGKPAAADMSLGIETSTGPGVAACRGLNKGSLRVLPSKVQGVEIVKTGWVSDTVRLPPSTTLSARVYFAASFRASSTIDINDLIIVAMTDMPGPGFYSLLTPFSTRSITDGHGLFARRDTLKAGEMAAFAATDTHQRPRDATAKTLIDQNFMAGCPATIQIWPKSRLVEALPGI